MDHERYPSGPGLDGHSTRNTLEKSAEDRRITRPVQKRESIGKGHCRLDLLTLSEKDF